MGILWNVLINSCYTEVHVIVARVLRELYPRHSLPENILTLPLLIAMVIRFCQNPIFKDFPC